MKHHKDLKEQWDTAKEDINRIMRGEKTAAELEEERGASSADKDPTSSVAAAQQDGAKDSTDQKDKDHKDKDGKDKSERERKKNDELRKKKGEEQRKKARELEKKMDPAKRVADDEEKKSKDAKTKMLAATGVVNRTKRELETKKIKPGSYWLKKAQDEFEATVMRLELPEKGEVGYSSSS